LTMYKQDHWLAPL